MSTFTSQTWMDGFGRWHVTIPASTPGQEARRAHGRILSELVDREQKSGESRTEVMDRIDPGLYVGLIERNGEIAEYAESPYEGTPYTVTGVWSGGTPIAAGAIAGVHDVAGDLDYYRYRPWATVVGVEDGQNEDDAMKKAIEKMEAQHAAGRR